jgi:isocitrate dehydrogenase
MAARASELKQHFAASNTQPAPVVTLAEGDGIGPEITAAVLSILDAAGAKVQFDRITVGEKCYLDGVMSGIPESAWESIRQHRVMLKGPITTPQGGGYKSLNVTMRKSLGLFANVRPCQAWHPWIETRHPDMDVLIVRENEEDTYAGIEHRQTAEVTQCLKLISEPASERLIRYAFELARAQGRKRVDCFSKDNIMKITDGLFHRVFDRVAKDYPDLASGHYIIDIGTALLADRPEQFDVIVAPNLYGDIISDVAAQITGSVGLGGSVNVGEDVAMFEAVHGSAPDIAGKDIANPSGLLLAAINMLRYLGDTDTAARIQQAWQHALADGVHTADIYRDGKSQQKVGTRAFAEAVIARLPSADATDIPSLPAWPQIESQWPSYTRPEKTLVGLDVFLDWDAANRDATQLGKQLTQLTEGLPVSLSLITNRGVKVYPNGLPETRCTDHWRCRFRSENDQAISHEVVIKLLGRVHEVGLDFIKTEHLYCFDGERGFSLAQGE